MPQFGGVDLPNFKDPRMTQEERIAALARAIIEMNEKYRFVLNNIDDGNFSNAYSDEAINFRLFTEKVSAAAEALNNLNDYVVWRGDVARANPITDAPDSWRVRKWKSGRIEADVRVQATNQDPLTYMEHNGVYYTNCLTNGIMFPFLMQEGFFLSITPHQVRMGLAFNQTYYDTNQIKGVYLWSPVTAPFAVTGTQFIDLYIHLDGIPVQ